MIQGIIQIFLCNQLGLAQIAIIITEHSKLAYFCQNLLMKANPKEILVHMKVVSTVGERCYFSVELTHKNIQNYHLNEEKETIIPYRNSVMFINDSEIAEINLSKLYEFPHHRHVLHVTTYSKKNIFAPTSEYTILVDILRVKLDREGDRTFSIRFLDAMLSRNTETFGRMKTYLKLFVSQQLIWQSAVDNKGNRSPVYNEARTFNFDKLEDKIKVEIWDKDLKSDDLVGEFWVYAYELLAIIGEHYSSGLTYQGKAAGIINYIVEQGPKVDRANTL